MTGKIVLDHAELAGRIRALQAAGRKVVFTNGCFDLLHVGHLRLLRAARAEGDALVVGLNDDESVFALKGEGRPLQTQEERAEIVAALDPVDYVTVFSGLRADGILRDLRPDVHAKGTDYAPEDVPEAPTVASIGARIAIVGDPKNHATKEIISRIRDAGI